MKHPFYNRRAWIIFLTCWSIYLFHVGPLPGVNENRYIDLTRSIIDDGSFTIDRFHYNTVDKAYHDGHYYAGAAPGPALLAIPAYLLIRMMARFHSLTAFSQYDTASYIREKMGGETAPDAFVRAYPFSEFVVDHIVFTGLICSLLAALTAVLLYILLGEFRVRETHRLIVVAIYAFGTITFFYATRFYAHAPSTFFVFLSFALLHAIYHGRMTPNWGGTAGLSLGMAVLMEYTAAPVAATLGIAGILLLKGRHRGFFLGGAIIPVGLLALYHGLCFGNPLATPYSFPMSPENPGPHIDQMATGFHGFGFPTATSLWGLSFSPYRGLFMYSPALLIGVVTLIRRIRDRTDAYRFDWVIIAGAFLMQFLFNSAMLRFWSGGYVFGPRYLMPVIPFLMLPLGRAFGALSSRLILALGAISILINWAGVQYIVSQNAFGSVAMFLLSGPTTQLYEFFNMYFKTYTTWNIAISPLGGYLMLGIVLTMIWKGTWRSSRRKASGASMNS